MRIFTATAAPGFASQIFITDTTTTTTSITTACFPSSINFPKSSPNSLRNSSFSTLRSSSSSSVPAASQAVDQPPPPPPVDESSDNNQQTPSAPATSRISADWKTAKTFLSKGLIYRGRVEGFNGGGLLVRFQSLLGFLPFPQLSPSHSCKEPQKNIQEIAKDLCGSSIFVKVLQADEENRRLIFSEKEAVWTKFSPHINVGDVYEAMVGSVEDYGAFLHLRFPDGCYHVTGLVHVSEVSWDLVQDVRDVLTEGDIVKAKIIKIDREKSRITLSLKQLEEDPLLETLDKVIPQNGSLVSDSSSTEEICDIEPLPGLAMIIVELLQEDGINDIEITRQGFEKRVVSQDLQLWLSNAPPIDDQFTLLARAGRQVQEIQLTTTLDQEGIKKALQRVLERVP